MISAVSFGNTTTQPATFAERIRQPQTYIVKEEPAAASSIRGINKKESAGKKFFRFILTAAAVAGALALAAKSGKFKVPEGSTGIVNKIKGFIDTAGNKVLEFVHRIFPAAKEKAGEAATEAAGVVA